jgi:polysaccharide biosynthesis protein PslG
MSEARQRALLREMKAAGVDWLRIDYYPRSPSLAHLILSAQDAGISVDAILEDFGTSPDRFASFAADAVARLNSRAYEILNEVNLAGVPASAYVPVLKAAYAAIKRGQPRAIVLASGLGPGPGASEPYRYLNAMYAAGAKNYFDAANLHPYSYPAMPWPARCQSWNAFCYDAPAMHSVMVGHGDGDKPIWFTEFGCPTGTQDGYPKACSYQRLAAQLTQAYGQTRKWPWARAFFVFDWQDDDVDGDFGLRLSSGAPKPFAFAAFKRFSDYGLFLREEMKKGV